MMSLSLAGLAAMMTVRRRADDPDRDTSVRLYAKQVAPVVLAVLAGVGGYKYAPLPPDRSAVALHEQITVATKALQDLSTRVALMDQSQHALSAKVQEISDRRTAQVDILEKRIMTCELDIARGRAK